MQDKNQLLKQNFVAKIFVVVRHCSLSSAENNFFGSNRKWHFRYENFQNAVDAVEIIVDMGNVSNAP